MPLVPSMCLFMWINRILSKSARAISKILFDLGSYNFLAYLEWVRSYAWSKGHSDPDLSSVGKIIMQRLFWNLEYVSCYLKVEQSDTLDWLMKIKLSPIGKARVPSVFLQVNIFQKHLFLHQLTHNMAKECSLNCKFSTWKLQAQCMLCTKIVLNVKTKTKNNLRTQHVYLWGWVVIYGIFKLMQQYWTCHFLVLNSQFNEKSL